MLADAVGATGPTFTHWVIAGAVIVYTAVVGWVGFKWGRLDVEQRREDRANDAARTLMADRLRALGQPANQLVPLPEDTLEVAWSDPISAGQHRAADQPPDDYDAGFADVLRRADRHHEQTAATWWHPHLARQFRDGNR
jgi:hypothetical protein